MRIFSAAGGRTAFMFFGNLLAAACLWAGAASAAAQEPAPGVAVVFVAKTAEAVPDAVPPGDVVPTLQAAVDRAREKLRAGFADVTIRVLPGHYIGEHVKSPGAGAGRSIAITGDEAAPGRVMFDGEGQGTWLAVQGAAGGAPANLTISGVTVRRYATAISLNGSRDDPAQTVSRVVIRNNVFDTIGQSDPGREKPSTAVVRLVNGDDNLIAGNLFVRVRNVQQCALLHSIYLAHGSTGNVIRNNRFEDACGDAIRFRDGANDNVVAGNRFKDAWAKTPVSAWFCDASKRDDCTKRGGECPALDNTLIGNQVVAERLDDNGLATPFGDISTAACPAPAGARHFIVR